MIHQSEKLKPCRLCGGKCVVQPINDDGTLWVCENDPMFGGECFDGVAYTSERSWNTRPLSMTGEMVEELRLWIMLVNEGDVPRYTVTPGAALNTVVTSTKRLLARHDAAIAAIQEQGE